MSASDDLRQRMRRRPRSVSMSVFVRVAAITIFIGAKELEICGLVVPGARRRRRRWRRTTSTPTAQNRASAFTPHRLLHISFRLRHCLHCIQKSLHSSPSPSVIAMLMPMFWTTIRYLLAASSAWVNTMNDLQLRTWWPSRPSPATCRAGDLRPAIRTLSNALAIAGFFVQCQGCHR